MSKKSRIPADGELTIHDFANSKNPRGKCRKSTLFSTHVIKQQLDVFDDDNEDPDIIQQPKNKKLSKNKHEDSNNHSYNDYHIDIWHLISKYIYPEDVGRFALICKKTDEVVASAKFWFNLYRRYCSPSITLPQHLQSDCFGPAGLRSKVISSLFYAYPPFVTRLNSPPNLDNLLNMQLLTTWYKQEEKIWIFCYRFSNSIKVRKSPRQQYLRYIKDTNTQEKNNSDDENWLENCCDNFIAKYNNIFDNPAEGNHLLVIFTKRFLPSPIFYGQKVFLNSIRQPIAQGFRTYNLELKFSN